MKRILGLDLGTNSIGWALIKQDFDKKEGEIDKLGVRIIPVSQDVLGKFDAGQSISQTAERTSYRGVRRLYQRDNLRRDRLHRILIKLDFLPKHYAESIDFEKKLGQFKKELDVKINYKKDDKGKHQFIFLESFKEMVEEFKKAQPQLFYTKANGKETKIPYDWTIYYLRKKALTQPVSKEELAWIILNFNQKRGYYQLRGEELEDDNKAFLQLKVKTLLKTDQQIKGKTLFEVIFENGWKYDKLVINTEDWADRTKEFIVTSKTLKSGDVKRTFKNVDSEKDWAAIKAKTENDIINSDKTVGTFIYETLLNKPTQKVRGKLVKTIERKFYKEELKQILKKQINLQPHLFTNQHYNACIKELYPLNEAHRTSLKDKGFLHLFLEDIIFYQRPLKSKKSNIAGCALEFRQYKQKNKKTGASETVKQAVKTISKSHPLFQEFRIWQWLHNLKIYNTDKIENGKIKDVTKALLKNEDDYVALFDYLNTKKELEQKQLLDYFIKKKLIDKTQKASFKWNYVEDKKYPFAETRIQLLSRLKKVNGVNNATEFLDKQINENDKEDTKQSKIIHQLWHIIYSITDPTQYNKALKKFASKYKIDTESFVDNFVKFPPLKSDYASYSHKAISKLLPLMRMGKYWDETILAVDVKERAKSIMERVAVIDPNDKNLKTVLENISDDDIAKQLIKSFIPLKDKSPLKGLNTYQATYLVYGKHSEVGEVLKWNKPNDIDNYLSLFKQHTLRNPIVEQVVTETLRVVRDIWKYYGNSQPKFFNEIHVELGREMKNPAKKREAISKKNIENENTNARIKTILQELMKDSQVYGDIRHYSPSHQEILKLYEEGVYQNPNVNYTKVSEDDIQKIRRSNKPTQKDIQKYKLWLEQGYISPYTGKPIMLTELFTEKYQIEHIIPQSRYFDNSLTNKIICESEVNQDKSNKTAYEYLKEKNGSIVEGYKLLSLSEFKSHVHQYFKKNKTKLKNLLSEDIPEGFINRQLNDSRYISKLIKGLLSNIVRDEGEQQATSKKLIPVTGAVTAKLKQDWGLNDKWNEIIKPRFKRLNTLTNSEDFGYWDEKINAFRTQVPNEISKGFSKKRIDHRHHALDALVVACTTRNHTHYLSTLNAEKENFSLRDKLLTKSKNGDYTKTMQLPWQGFSLQTKNQLESIIISFKQNLRVINKTNNKFWSYKDEIGKLNVAKDGKPKKILRKQTKGDNWAIRKPLHKETVAGIYKIDVPKGKTATSVRTSLTEIKNEKHLAKITDQCIREIILPNHLKNYLDENGAFNFDNAFSVEGVDDLNKNIFKLNNNQNHKPIYKVKMYEVGSKFSISEKKQSSKSKKYVETAKGTNLFFAVYWDENRQKRNYETVPLNEVITHQKQVAHLKKIARLPIQPNTKLGKFLFTLSPNDLVYVPTDEELDNLEDFNSFSIKQIDRIYKMVSSSGNQCFFIKANVAKSIQNKFEFSPLNKMEKTINGIMIKERCIKLKINRLGDISKA